MKAGSKLKINTKEKYQVYMKIKDKIILGDTMNEPIMTSESDEITNLDMTEACEYDRKLSENIDIRNAIETMKKNGYEPPYYMFANRLVDVSAFDEIEFRLSFYIPDNEFVLCRVKDISDKLDS